MREEDLKTFVIALLASLICVGCLGWIFNQSEALKVDIKTLKSRMTVMEKYIGEIDYKLGVE